MSGSFVDTNIVIYSISQDEIKNNIAIELLARQPVSSVQVLSETANVMRKKLGFDVPSVKSVVERIARECATIQPITISTLWAGLDLSDRYGFSHFDSLVVASALEAGCAELYSEDMHHGLIVNQRLTIINPFQ
jgi:predicted nucleic acid-binding protein